LDQIALADATLVGRQATAAARAQEGWAALPYEERAYVMRKATRLADEHAPAIVDWLVRESGSTHLKSDFEHELSTRSVHEAAALPSRCMGEVLPSQSGRLSLAPRRPPGVVGVISPFNFPLYLAMRAVAPVLALGNAVVLKPDLRTAIYGGLVIARLFELAGLAAGVLQVLPGDRATGPTMTSDQNIAMIQFTGSTAAGRKVGEAAGRNLKKVSLELGGKNSLILLDDVALDLAVINTAWGVYLHQGQICKATGRVLIQRGIYDAFLDRLTAKACALKAGDPVRTDIQIGPLINEQQRDNVLRIIKAARLAGAAVRTGGTYEGLLLSLSDVGQSRIPRGILRTGRSSHAIRHQRRSDRTRQRHRVRSLNACHLQ
jgi:benzaldehyde dehydrogenase (NAD)